MELIIDADMSGRDSGGESLGGSPSCEGSSVERNDGDERFSTLEIEANAIANSLVLLQREGAELAEGAELDWYPNDILSERVMQFSFDVKSSFGRYVDSVRLLMRTPMVFTELTMLSTRMTRTSRTQAKAFSRVSLVIPGSDSSGEYG